MIRFIACETARLICALGLPASFVFIAALTVGAI